MNLKRNILIVASILTGSIILFQNASTQSEYNPIVECKSDVLCAKIISAMMLGRTDSQGRVNNELELIDLAAERLGYGLSSLESYIQPVDGDTKDKTTAKLHHLALVISRQLQRNNANGMNPALDDLIAEIAPSLHQTQLQVVQKNAYLSKKTQEWKDKIDELCAAPPFNGNLSQCQQSVAFEKLNFYYTQARMKTTQHRFEVGSQEPKVQLLRKIVGSQTFSGSVVHDTQVNIPEVLSEFWFNHFNIDRKKTQMAGAGNDGYDYTIRQHVFDKFKNLLFAVETHPAMLVYLDNQSNQMVDGKPSNQNLGRELLELHSFGVGTEQAGYNGKIIYNQADVELASKILAGVGIKTERNANGIPTVYRGAYLAYRGVSKLTGDDSMIFGRGRSYDSDYYVDANGNKYGKLKKLTEDLSNHPQVQSFICLKIIGQFMTPTSSAKQSCLETWRDTDGNLKAIYQDLMTQPEFWAPANYRSRMKNPLELVVSAMRLQGANMRDTVDLTLKQIVTASEPYWDDSDNKVHYRPIKKTVYFGDELLVTAEHEVARLGLSYRRTPPPTGYETIGFKWRGAGYIARITDASMNISSVYEVFSESFRAPLHTDNKEALFSSKLSSNPTDAYKYVFLTLLKQDWGNISAPTFYQRQTMMNAARGNDTVDLRGPASSAEPIKLKTVLTLSTANRWFLFK